MSILHLLLSLTSIVACSRPPVYADTAVGPPSYADTAALPPGYADTAAYRNGQHYSDDHTHTRTNLHHTVVYRGNCAGPVCAGRHR